MIELKMSSSSWAVPNFCYKCGMALVQSEYLINRYNEQTGKKIKNYRLKCPMYNWFGGHTDYEFDSTGNLIENYDY